MRQATVRSLHYAAMTLDGFGATILRTNDMVHHDQARSSVVVV